MKVGIILRILALLALTPGMCQAVIVDYFYTDGTIQDGDVYDIVVVKNDATLDVLGGQVSQLYAHDFSTINFYAGLAGSVNITSTSTFNLAGLLSCWVDIGASARFNINEGVFDGKMTATGGRININGGIADLATNSYISNFSVLDIYGGDISFNGMRIDRYAELNIYGGEVTFDRDNFGYAFRLSPWGAFNVYYSDIIYGNGGTEILGYHLLDGSEFMLDQFNQQEINLITFIPEPATFLILAIGGIFLRSRK